MESGFTGILVVRLLIGGLLLCPRHPGGPAADGADGHARVVHVGAVLADPGLPRCPAGVAAGGERHEVVVRLLGKF